MFLQNIMVAARARGLDTCPQAAFIGFHDVIEEHLALPRTEMVVCGMSLGHADESAPENRLVTEREPVSVLRALPRIAPLPCVGRSCCSARASARGASATRWWRGAACARRPRRRWSTTRSRRPTAWPFEVDGRAWPYHERALILLHKPAGYECSQKPRHHPGVLTLLPPPLRRRGVQPVGRLDEDTTGALLLTDDGALIHRLSSPKHHVPKVYEVTASTR